MNTSHLPYQKRVLFVITGLSVGGAETQLCRTAIQLSRRGWKVRIVTLLPPKAYVEELKRWDIPVATLNIQRKRPDPRPALHLSRIFRAWKPDIVHSHMVHANLLARASRLLVPVPVLISSARSIYEGSRLREILYRLTDPLCDITTHVCQAGAERYVRIGAVPAHKMRHIPNGVDADAFRPDPSLREQMRRELGMERAFVWLAVGRLETPKDYPNLLNAFAFIYRQHSDSRLLIAGDGPLRVDMENLASSLGIETAVRFLGVRRDIARLMNAADAYVMSSSREGLPNVLLEAHATALPIVATDVGGNREAVRDGVSGIIVPPRDPSALAEAMIRLMQMDTSHRREMGEAGREHIVQNYSMEAVVQRWEQLYRELLEAKGAEPRRLAKSGH